LVEKKKVPESAFRPEQQATSKAMTKPKEDSKTKQMKWPP